MKIIKFDCKGYNTPAYGCSEPSDNSGYYIKVNDLINYIEKQKERLLNNELYPAYGLNSQVQSLEDLRRNIIELQDNGNGEDN